MSADPATDPTLDPRFVAAVDLIGRTGARSFQIRWSDDVEPTVWFAVAEYAPPAGPDVPAALFDAAAGMDPTRAVLRLCATMVDGGVCAHCGRPAGFDEDMGEMPLEGMVCWYQWDPELETFRRGCEGDT